MDKVILASSSPRRSELLQQIGVGFTVVPSEFKELTHADAPQDLVVINALGKAKQVASTMPSGIVLGADTVVVLGNDILGKPQDRHNAQIMLERLSGRWHEVVTGVALVDAKTGRELADAVTTRVHMRPITPGELSSYLDTDEPYDKAGAYGIQGMAARFIDRIEGCYSNVVGLPLSRLCELLASFS